MGDSPIRSIFTHHSQSGLRALFLMILAILLMVMDKRLGSFTVIRDALTLPMAPLQYVVNWPADAIEALKTNLDSRENLIADNTRLKTEQLILKTQLQRLLAIESENNYLKALFQSSRQIKGKTLIAELLAVSSEPFLREVTIDKGTRDGVYLGQPVLDANGVMGQVASVGPITSRVLLINDTRSGISVQNMRNGLRAIAVGDGYSGKLRLMYIPKTMDIRIGDMFITSGLGAHYPEGYPVGKVVNLVKDPSHQFANVFLQPAAHLESSRQVLLAWYAHD